MVVCGRGERERERERDIVLEVRLCRQSAYPKAGRPRPRMKRESVAAGKTSGSMWSCNCQIYGNIYNNTQTGCSQFVVFKANISDLPHMCNSHTGENGTLFLIPNENETRREGASDMSFN